MSWQSDVLSGLGAPVYEAGLQALTLWAQSEGMPAWENNWLATTEPGFGGTDVNGVGVKAYPSEATGVAATVATLTNGYYTAVVDAFRSQQDMAHIWSAVNESPWCGGCQSGHYPVALWQAVVGSIPVTTIHITPPSPGPSSSTTVTQSWEQVRHFGHTRVGELVTMIQNVGAAILYT